MIRRQKDAATRPEYIVDASNPQKIRVWCRADIFEQIVDVVDADERRAGAELAIERLAAQLRKARAA